MSTEKKVVDKRQTRNFAILILVVAYVVFKIIYLNIYDHDNISTKETYKEFTDHFVINDTMTINHKKTTDELYQFKNIKIRNDFKNYEELPDNKEENTIKLALYDDKKNLKKSFWITKSKNLVSYLKYDVDVYNMVSTYDKNSKSNNSINLRSIIEKNDLNTDVELLKYLENHKNDKSTILTPCFKIKQTYDLQQFAFIMMPQLDHITLINGDYEGYILYVKSGIIEVNIEKDGYKYTFLFMDKNDISDDYIKELISTLEIK